MAAIENKVLTAALSINGTDTQSMVAPNSPTSTEKTEIINPSDVPTVTTVKANPEADDINERVAAFLEAFSKKGATYTLIDFLNNELKPLHRETRERESEALMDNYATQYKLALQKSETIIEKADEIKDLALKKAKLMRDSGYVQAGFSIAGSTQVGAGVSGVLNGYAEALSAKIDHLKALLEAEKTELDAEATLAGQSAQLSDAHRKFIDELNRTVSQIVNELHSQHSGTLQQLGRTIA